jgi:FkbH-like protein
MRADAGSFQEADVARLAQLINKTNQFNLNGRRLTDEEVRAIVDGGGRLFSATLTDRTGNHGEILACLVAPDRIITTFVMSCRVFQRRVEYAFLAWLAAQSSPPIGLHWGSTPGNAPFGQFLREVAGPLDGVGVVRLDPATVTTRYARDLGLFALRQA